jgi:hypothetical protein
MIEQQGRDCQPTHEHITPPPCPLGCTATPQRRGTMNKFHLWRCPDCGYHFEILDTRREGKP